MFHKMSELRGWTHNEMMDMDKRVFYRYYGYWYSDRLADDDIREKEEQERMERQTKQQLLDNLDNKL